MPSWAEYAEWSANRRPSEFFEHAMATIDGERGHGRLVVDLGCGAGVETRAFLERGWSVFAIDSEPRAVELLQWSVPGDDAERLETRIANFMEVELPPADLVYAQLSLSFAPRFEDAVAWAIGAVQPRGWFIAQLLGPRDSWAGEGWVTTVTRDGLERLLLRFDPLNVIEEELDGDSSVGLKHWHLFRVEAQRV